MKQADKPLPFTIRNAEKEDVPLILDFIRKLGDYERAIGSETAMLMSNGRK